MALKEWREWRTVWRGVWRKAAANGAKYGARPGEWRGSVAQHDWIPAPDQVFSALK